MRMYRYKIARNIKYISCDFTNADYNASINIKFRAVINQPIVTS